MSMKWICMDIFRAAIAFVQYRKLWINGRLKMPIIGGTAVPQSMKYPKYKENGRLDDVREQGGGRGTDTS
jgi:hypothetical protein